MVKYPGNLTTNCKCNLIRACDYQYKLKGHFTNTTIMATSKQAGYECEFISSIQDEYLCNKCKHVAREANTTTCCRTTTFCKECIETIIQETKVCPSCTNDQPCLEQNTTLQAKILALNVCCSKGHLEEDSSYSCDFTSNMFKCMFTNLIRCHTKVQGCKWTGQLKDLDDHNCDYVDKDCPNDCGQKVQKRNLKTHCTNECPNQDNQCLNYRMTFCGAFQHLTDYQDHSHGYLGDTIEHKCSKQKVPCELSCIVCEAATQQQDDILVPTVEKKHEDITKEFKEWQRKFEQEFQVLQQEMKTQYFLVQTVEKKHEDVTKEFKEWQLKFKQEFQVLQQEMKTQYSQEILVQDVTKEFKEWQQEFQVLQQEMKTQYFLVQTVEKKHEDVTKEFKEWQLKFEQEFQVLQQEMKTQYSQEILVQIVEKKHKDVTKEFKEWQLKFEQEFQVLQQEMKTQYSQEILVQTVEKKHEDVTKEFKEWQLKFKQEFQVLQQKLKDHKCEMKTEEMVQTVEKKHEDVTKEFRERQRKFEKEFQDQQALQVQIQVQLETVEKNHKVVANELREQQQKLKQNFQDLQRALQNQQEVHEIKIQGFAKKLKASFEKALNEQQEEFQRQLKDMQHQKLETIHQQKSAELHTIIPKNKETLGTVRTEHRPDINSLASTYEIVFTHYPNISRQLLKIHPKGYVYHLMLHPNGTEGRAGPQLSFKIALPYSKAHIPLEHKDHRPSSLTITIELVNQHRDQDHITRVMKYESSYFAKHDTRFISLADLECK